MDAERIAALPMYDFPDRTTAHGQLWQALAKRLEMAGIKRIPQALSRSSNYRNTWHHPSLIFGQACEYPLATSRERPPTIIATPYYHVPGCDHGRYSSAIIVRKMDDATSIPDLFSRCCAVNQINSNSGMNLLRVTIARYAGGAPFFGSILLSGSHLNSARMVADERADVAALDCVSYAHVQRFAPEVAARLRILAWTPNSPSLPFITSHINEEATVKLLRQALEEIATDSSIAETLRDLYITGFDINPDASFSEVMRLQQEAISLDYPVLC